jgi:hypothetical protein
MRSEPPLKPRAIQSRRCEDGRSVLRDSVLSVFAFYRIDPGRCPGEAEEGKHTSANQDLYIRALHMHRRARVMAPGERIARSAADYSFQAIFLNLQDNHSPVVTRWRDTGEQALSGELETRFPPSATSQPNTTRREHCAIERQLTSCAKGSAIQSSRHPAGTAEARSRERGGDLKTESSQKSRRSQA